MTQEEFHIMKEQVAGLYVRVICSVIACRATEEYKLNSLVHFCQTGKFLDEPDN